MLLLSSPVFGGELRGGKEAWCIALCLVPERIRACPDERVVWACLVRGSLSANRSGVLTCSPKLLILNSQRSISQGLHAGVQLHQMAWSWLKGLHASPEMDKRVVPGGISIHILAHMGRASHCTWVPLHTAYRTPHTALSHDRTLQLGGREAEWEWDE